MKTVPDLPGLKKLATDKGATAATTVSGKSMSRGTDSQWADTEQPEPTADMQALVDQQRITNDLLGKLVKLLSP